MLVILCSYIISVIINLLYIRYSEEDKDSGEFILLLTFLPVINVGVTIMVLANTIIYFFDLGKLYNFIRYYKKHDEEQ